MLEWLSMVHILIIEDEPRVAMLIEAALEEEGVSSFEIVDSEADAIAAARHHPPDLITSDVTLREGLGPHAVRAIRSQLGVIPVIFITGTPEDCEPCEPPDIILAKPFRLSDLGNAFRRSIARS